MMGAGAGTAIISCAILLVKILCHPAEYEKQLPPHSLPTEQTNSPTQKQISPPAEHVVHYTGSKQATQTDSTQPERQLNELEKFEQGLQDWVEQAPSGEKEARMLASQGILKCFRDQSDFLFLNSKKLTSLPDEMLRLSPRLSIRLANNPLSPRVIENLRQVMNATGYTGPRIHFSMSEVRQTEERSLDDLLKELSLAAGKELIVLERLKDDANLPVWLSRLSSIGDYKTKRKELAPLIYRAIVKAEAEADFRDVFVSCISDATSTCGDRMALSLLYLDLQFQIAESLKKGDLAQLAYLIGHGSWALSRLEKIAGYKASTLNFVDEVEVYLAYPVKLKEALKLPIAIDTMLYFACSSVTAGDLKEAEKRVKVRLSNKNAYSRLLAKDPTWQKALEAKRAQDYAEIADKKNVAFETLSDTTDAKACKDIDRQFKQDLAALTLQILGEGELPPFL